MPQLIEICDAAGALLETGWLARAEVVHRQLRPQLETNYTAQMRRIFAGGGRMVVAVEDQRMFGLAVWRLIENTASGRVLYVDDLITDEAQRSTGVGHALLGWCEARARELGCAALTLDSGTQRHRAHAFYLRERMNITSFHFAKIL